MVEYIELYDSLNECINSNIETVKIDKCCTNSSGKIDKLFLSIMYREVAELSQSIGDIEIAKEYLRAGIDNCECYNCGC